MAAKSKQLFLYCAAAFAFCCWCVQLGGLAALYHDCNNLPDSLAAYARANDNTSAADIFQQISNFNNQYNYGTAPRCARQFSLQWFLLFLYFVIIVASVACASSPHAARLSALAWAILLAAVSALFWLFCQRYDTINWSLSNVHNPLWQALGSIKSSLRCLLAGYVLNSFAAFLLFFGLIKAHNDAAAAAAARPVSDAPDWPEMPKASTSPVPQGVSTV